MANLAPYFHLNLTSAGQCRVPTADHRAAGETAWRASSTVSAAVSAVSAFPTSPDLVVLLGILPLAAPGGAVRAKTHIPSSDGRCKKDYKAECLPPLRSSIKLNVCKKDC